MMKFINFFSHSLRLRLTISIALLVVLPITIMAIIVSVKAVYILQNQIENELFLHTTALANNVIKWDEEMSKMLRTLSVQPGIVSMDATLQQPILKKIISIYPHVYLVSTINLKGINVARSDDEPLKNYHDRSYFTEAIAGQLISRQILISRTTGQPAIVFSTPIKNDKNQIVGVIMLGTELVDVTEQVNAHKLGTTGFAFVVNEQGKILAHPEQNFATTLKNFAHYPPVKSLLTNTKNVPLHFTDENNVRWLFYGTTIENGWGVILQIQEQEFMQEILLFQKVALIFVLFILLMVSFLTWIVANHLVRPLSDMTQAAMALANGQLTQELTVDRQDELGQLAQAFNIMVKQLDESFKKIGIKNKELIKLNQEKNDFLGIVAHDLKNPLHAILGLAEMIQDIQDPLPTVTMQEYAKHIQESAENMYLLISNLLDVNAIESGKINIHLDYVDILPIVHNLTQIYRKQAKIKNINLYLHSTENQYIAFVSENTVYQILDNLISNAVKYSPFEKNVHIYIYENVEKIRCEVKDEGPGLCETDQNKLFNKFTRLQTKPTGGEHSTGLGLFIVKKLVTFMQGKVWCESELGHGATFIVEFPISCSKSI